MILYKEIKALDKRVLKEGPFVAAGADDLDAVFINGDKGIISEDRNCDVSAKTY